MAGRPEGRTSRMAVSLEMVKFDLKNSPIAWNLKTYTPAWEKPIELQDTSPLTKFFTSIPVTEASTGFLINSVKECRTRQRKKYRGQYASRGVVKY